MSHLAAQRAVVRMLFDPAFAEAVRRDPAAALPGIDPALQKQLAALDERALRQDRLRRRRTLRTLSEEWKGATTLALAETGRLGFLEEFFCDAAFHRAVEERGSLPLAFGEFLSSAVASGRLKKRETAGVLALETALARARREAQNPPPPKKGASRAPGVIVVATTRGALAALQACERYLFEVGLMPAVALCDDAPPLELPPFDETPLTLLTVPLDSGVSLVEIDAELGELLARLPTPPDDPRLRELAADEIVVIHE